MQIIMKNVNYFSKTLNTINPCHYLSMKFLKITLSAYFSDDNHEKYVLCDQPLQLLVLQPKF
jgi:hypothetical protein